MSENQSGQNSDETIIVNKSDTTSTESTAAEVQTLKEQAEKFKNDYLYLRAEFDNYKRHAIKERADMAKYGAERLIVDLLNVVDNFERALSVKINSDNFETYAKGVEMTAAELRTLLTKFGVTELTKPGDMFDPNIHEALTSEPTNEFETGSVSRVLRKAYKLHDKMIRPAQVVVAQKPN